MGEPVLAKEPFRFFTRLHLTELTGLKASNIKELLYHLERVPGSCIYHHTHRFLQQHQYLSPEPPNDFAYWVLEAINESDLSERLASIDTVQYPTIRKLRERIIEVISSWAASNPGSRRKKASPGDEFHFMKTKSFIVPTKYEVSDLNSFAEVLEKVTIDSIYFHIFESRLRLEKGSNDFSNWFEASLGDGVLAKKVSRLDPYTCTLEDLRCTLIRMVKNRIGG
ncbi:MAG: DUF5752 family protein [Candidatus Margulisiibacteriota bacterium]